MKSVNVQKVQQLIDNSCCTLLNISQPITFQSEIMVGCSCGNKFTVTIKKIHGYICRGTKINCGCLQKKWTNDSIDRSVSNRNIVRLTDCNVQGFQPSCTKIKWQCNLCTHQWYSRVDSVINKLSGCPKCAGNLAYTVDTLTVKLQQLCRSDLRVVRVYNGTATQQRTAVFKCASCDNNWIANIHNVIKFNYGCPKCNSNLSTPIQVDNLKFHSKLEYYLWQQYHNKQIKYTLQRQRKYLSTRRLTCDYYIAEKQLWIEVTGQYLLNTKRYRDTIEEKRRIIQQRNEQFITVSSIAEINKLITKLSEQQSHEC